MEKAEVILSLFKQDERKAFQLLFDTYYDTLLLFANQILEDVETAEDVVQDCFVDFWVNKRFTELESGLDKYIFQAVKHAALNYLRGQHRREKRHLALQAEEADFIRLEEDEINEVGELYRAINELPEDRRKIFMMICMEGMKYQEVADQLHISINTVKKQMGRSFKFLRERLQKGLSLSLLFFLKKIRCFCHTKSVGRCF